MATKTWTGAGPDTNWSTPANWSDGSTPAPGDDVVFDATSGKDCTVDEAVDVGSIDVQSTYAGTVTQADSVHVGAAFGVDGAWQCSGYDLTVDGAVTIGANGSLAAGSGSLSVGGDWTVENGGSFDAGESTVGMCGTAAQTITMPEAAGNSFHSLRISNDCALGADLRCVDGVLTVDSGCILDLFAGGVGRDLYLRGTGDVLVLEGRLNGNGGGRVGGMVHYELAVNGTIHIAGGTGWNIDGSYSAVGIVCSLIGPVNGMFELQGDIDNCNSFSVRPGSSAGSLVFNTNDHHLGRFYSFIRFGNEIAGNDGAGEYNFGTSHVECNTICRFQHSGAVYNLGTSQWKVGDWSVYGVDTDAVDVAPVFNVGRSRVTVTRNVGEWWYVPGHPTSAEFYDLVLSREGSIDFHNTRITVHNALSVAPGTTVRFTPLTSHAVRVHRAGVLRITGSEPDMAVLRSSSMGTRWRLALERLSVVDHIDVQDCELSGAVVYAWQSVDSGNNSGEWRFAVPQFVNPFF